VGEGSDRLPLADFSAAKENDMDRVMERLSRFPMANETEAHLAEVFGDYWPTTGQTDDDFLHERDSMHPLDLDRFLNFTFEKSSEDIIRHCKAKISVTKDKIKERKARVTRIREEYHITDAALIKLLEQARAVMQRGAERMTYNVKAELVGSAGGGPEERDITIGAGTVENLLTEGDYIKAEEKQIQKLELIVRNLRDVPDEHGAVRGHRLSNQELTFLGF